MYLDSYDTSITVYINIIHDENIFSSKILITIDNMNVKLIIATIFYLVAIWKEFLPLLPFISLLYCK